MATTSVRTELRRTCAKRSATRLVVSMVLALTPAVLIALHPAWFNPWWLILLWPVQTVAMTGLSNGAHEAVHGHLMYRPRIDRLIGRLLHGLLLLNYDVHRRYHLTHHAQTGTENDSEGVFDFDRVPSVSTYVAHLLRWALPPSPLHILNWRHGLRALAGRPSELGPITRGRALAGFVVPVTAVAVTVWWLIVDPVAALLGAVLPQLVLFPLYAYVTALPEHFGLATRSFESRTRNVRTTPLLQYMLWNFNLHAVHHRWPGLHFSLLPGEVDRVSAPTANGYLRFHLHLLRDIGTADVAAPEDLGVRL